MADPIEGVEKNRNSDDPLQNANRAIHAATAEKAVYQNPSTFRGLGGRIILAFQSLTEKLLGGRLAQVQQQVIDQDRELSELTHDLGEVTTQIVQMKRKLESLEQRLARLDDGESQPEQDGA